MARPKDASHDVTRTVTSVVQATAKAGSVRLNQTGLGLLFDAFCTRTGTRFARKRSGSQRRGLAVGVGKSLRDENPSCKVGVLCL